MGTSAQGSLATVIFMSWKFMLIIANWRTGLPTSKGVAPWIRRHAMQPQLPPMQAGKRKFDKFGSVTTKSQHFVAVAVKRQRSTENPRWFFLSMIRMRVSWPTSWQPNCLSVKYFETVWQIAPPWNCDAERPLRLVSSLFDGERPSRSHIDLLLLLFHWLSVHRQGLAPQGSGGSSPLRRSRPSFRPHYPIAPTWWNHLRPH